MFSLLRSSVVALSIFVFSTVAGAETTTVPNKFTPGTPANAADVNANFLALANAITTLSARVDKLDGSIPATALTMVDLAGKYSIEVFGTVLKQNDADIHNSISTGVTQGTISLSIDGTVLFTPHSMTLTQTIFPTETTVRTPHLSHTANGSWSLSGGTLTIGVPDNFAPRNFSIASGGMILVSSSEGDGPGEMSIFLCVKK